MIPTVPRRRSGRRSGAGRRPRGDVHRRRRRARLRPADGVGARAQGVHGEPGPGHRRARPPRRPRRPGRAGQRRRPRRRARAPPGLLSPGAGRSTSTSRPRPTRGIPVVTTPGKNADAVAELTIAFMVMLARRLPEVLRHVESGGEFGHDNYEGAHWFGHDLAGHTLGIVGFGQIGRRVAVPGRRVRHAGRRRPTRSSTRATIVAAGAEPAGLDELLERSDFVTLHARATADNRGLIGTGPDRPDEARQLPRQHRPRHARRRGRGRRRARVGPARRGGVRRREPVAGRPAVTRSSRSPTS